MSVVPHFYKQQLRLVTPLFAYHREIVTLEPYCLKPPPKNRNRTVFFFQNSSLTVVHQLVTV